jgi:hypothetical protein
VLRSGILTPETPGPTHLILVVVGGQQLAPGERVGVYPVAVAVQFRHLLAAQRHGDNSLLALPLRVEKNPCPTLRQNRAKGWATRALSSVAFRGSRARGQCSMEKGHSDRIAVHVAEMGQRVRRVAHLFAPFRRRMG